MPEFILDTSGFVWSGDYDPAIIRIGGKAQRCMGWLDLDAFTQGYIEALFFTSGEHAGTMVADGMANVGVGFADLAPETLAAILADCAKFQGCAVLVRKGLCGNENEGGYDFWMTRQGHGCGFDDGDWPEPYATALTDAARSFPEVSPYLGDDGKVWL